MRLRDLIDLVDETKTLEEWFGKKRSKEESDREMMDRFADGVASYQEKNRNIPAEIRGATCNNPDRRWDNPCKNKATHLVDKGGKQYPSCDACHDPLGVFD